MTHTIRWLSDAGYVWLSGGGILQSPHGGLAEWSLSLCPFLLGNDLLFNCIRFNQRSPSPGDLITKVCVCTERIKSFVFCFFLFFLLEPQASRPLSEGAEGAKEPCFSLLHEFGTFPVCVMCMHVKGGKVTGVERKELRLLRRTVEKIEMSVVSNCLECIRMGRDSRYVSPVASHRLKYYMLSDVGMDWYEIQRYDKLK